MPTEETQGAVEPQSTDETTQVTANVEPKPEVEEADSQPEKGTGDAETGKPKLTDAEKAIRSLQRRMSRVTAEKALLKQELEATRQVLQRRASEESPLDDQADDDGEEDGWTEAEAKKPKPKQSDPKLTEEEVNRRAAEKAAALLEEREHVRAANSCVTAGRKAFKGFDDMLRTVADEVGGFYEEGSDRPTAIARALFEETDKPHEIIRYLADNPDIAAEIGELPPRRQIRRLTQIENELGQVSKPKPSNAPKPVEAPKGSPAGSGEPDPKDAEAWIAWRNKTAKVRA